MLPSDSDTRTLFRSELTVSGLNCVLEKWSWDGLLGNSVVFELSALPTSYDPDKIICDVTECLELPENTEFTVKESEHYLFVNFFLKEEVSDAESIVSYMEALTPEEKESRKQKILAYVAMKNSSVIGDSSN